MGKRTVSIAPNLPPAPTEIAAAKWNRFSSGSTLITVPLIN